MPALCQGLTETPVAVVEEPLQAPNTVGREELPEELECLGRPDAVRVLPDVGDHLRLADPAVLTQAVPEQVPGVQDALIHQQAEPAASNAVPIDAGVILPGELPIAVQAALDVLLAHVLVQASLEQRNVLVRLQAGRQRIPLPVHDIEAAEHRAVGIRQRAEP